MKKLHLFVLKSFIGPFLLTFIISNFLFLMIWLFKYIEDMVGKGLDMSIILEMIGYSAINQIPMSLPLAMLLSSIMTLGNIGETNELVACKSLGISLQKLIAPLILFTFFIAISAFVLSNNVIPVTTLKLRTLLTDISEKRPDISIPVGMFYDGIPNYNIYVDRKNDAGELLDVIIHDHSTTLKNNNVTIAKKAIIESSNNKQLLTLKLYDGYSLKEEDYAGGKKIKTYPLIQNSFKEQETSIRIDNTEISRSEGAMYKHHSRMMSFNQLVSQVDSVKDEKVRRALKKQKSLSRTYFYKYDSLISPDSIPAIATDAFLLLKETNLPKAKKAIKHATQLTRGAQTFINSLKESYRVANGRIVKYWSEAHKKFTLAVACLVLFFIGAPFGAITRKGGLAWPVVYSIILFVIYWVLNIVFEKLAKKEEIAIYLGMWMANLILFPIGMYFTYRATKDLPLLPKLKKKIN